MILREGTPVLMVHRRLFANDDPRFFVGTVEAYEGGIARISGHTWTRDALGGTWRRKADARTKIVSLASGTLIAYALPANLKAETLRLEYGRDNHLVLTNGPSFIMDLDERGGRSRSD
jgi:hypothetical protein